MLTEEADADLLASEVGEIIRFIVVVYDAVGIIWLHSFIVYVQLQCR